MFLCIAAVIIVGLVIVATSSSEAKVHSTKDRERLESTDLVETAYYEDNLGWIYDDKEVVKGMASFYETTGAHPYIP